MKKLFVGMLMGIVISILYTEYRSRVRWKNEYEERQRMMANSCPYFVEKGEKNNAYYSSPY